jgi:uncharacterized protein
LNSIAYYLRIAPDQLLVSLHSTGTEEELARLGSGQELRELLARKGIVHGIDQVALARASECIDKAENLPEPLILAVGTPPVADRDGLQLRFALHPLTLEETDENGQISQVEIFLTPLVHKGEFLTEHSPPVKHQMGKNIFGQILSYPHQRNQVFLPGENVTQDEETRQLIAADTGYPSNTATRKGSDHSLTLSIDRLIRTTSDRMQAQLCLRPAPPGHNLPNKETILHVLTEKHITFGHLPHAVEQCIDLCASEHRPRIAIIALGTLPVKGKDAWLRFEMETGPLPGKVMGNGEIDFRDRNMFIGVNKDQLIALKIPPTPGTAGRDIYGTPIAPLPGKDIAVRTMDDAALDETTGEIRALRSGVLSMVTENSVKVCSRQVVAQDVDYLTGNIISRDAVEIKGSIKTKFKVNALGDVLVGGDVEKGQLRSDSNAVIKGGVIGKLASVHARGDIDVNFVVQGRVLCGNKLILRQHASYSRLHSSGLLLCNPSSRVIASQLVAFGSISTGSVGSDMAPPSLLAAAVSPEQLHRYFELRRTSTTLAEAIDSQQRLIGLHVDSEELAELIADHKASLKQLAHFNMIFEKDGEPQDQGLSHALECTIVAKGKVFAGTEIRIGNSSMVLATTLTDVCFRLRDHIPAGASKRDIITIPNKK